MQTFTYQHDKHLGQFNGRFAYRARISDDVDATRFLESLANTPEEALADQTIRHEYLHWVTFRHSWFGKQIVGQRFLARRRYAKFGDLVAVTNYYKARTVYFALSYQTHEAVVSRLEKRYESGKETMTAKLGKEEIQLVNDVDQDCSDIAKRIGITRPAYERFLSSLLGEVATKEYGVQTYAEDKDGRPKLIEHAMPGHTLGLVNGAFSNQTESNGFSVVNFLRRLRRSTNTELGTAALSTESLATWLSVKLATEFDTWKRIFGVLGSPHPVAEASACYRSLCQGAVDFAFRYTLNGSARRAYWTADRLYSCAFNEMSHANRVNELLSLEYETLYYFYSHGN